MALDEDKALAEEVLKKYDRESDTMNYTGIMAKVVSAIAITFSIFQLYTAIFGVLDAHLQRAVHLGFALALSYLLYPSRKSWSRTKLHPIDLILAILGAAAAPERITGFKNANEAAKRLGKVKDKVWEPNQDNVEIYNELYEEYKTLHGYFGTGINDVMKHLNNIRERRK